MWRTPGSVRCVDSVPDTDRALVERAQQDRDMDAFETLYRRYVDRVHAFAYRRSGSAAVADDVTSATFERALRSIGSFRWRGGGFVPWLYRIAANELADHFRSEQRSRVAGAESARTHAPALDDGLLAEADTRELRRALGTLTARYQRAISLRYLAGLSHAEAAEAMGVPPPVMAVTLHRALTALAREMSRRDVS